MDNQGSTIFRRIFVLSLWDAGPTCVPRRSYLSPMEAVELAKVRVIEVAIIADQVLVTFSDGRIALLDADDLHRQSTEAPPEPEG